MCLELVTDLMVVSCSLDFSCALKSCVAAFVFEVEVTSLITSFGREIPSVSPVKDSAFFFDMLTPVPRFLLPLVAKFLSFYAFSYPASHQDEF